MEGLILKVDSISSSAFRSHDAILRRYIDKLDARFKVGTPNYSLEEINVTETSYELKIGSVAKYLLID